MNCGRTLVVILNWNGWEDTVACCRSLSAAGLTETDVLIFDNGSDNDSVVQIKNYLSRMAEKQDNETLECRSVPFSLSVFVCSGLIFKLHECSENLGFAKGCNFAAAYAKKAGYEYLLLLNNDTTVEADAFVRMRETLDEEKADIVIPQIRYFNEPDKFWNCGGEITRWGRVKYYHSGDSVASVNLPSNFPVGFATGCCLLCKVDFFIDIGGFTERFFFGEEDVELSLRLKGNACRTICDTRAVVFHKVGSSLRGDDELLSRKGYVHVLNRLVNMRSYMPLFLWVFWALAVCLRLYFSRSYSFPRPMSYVVKLFVESCMVNGVDKYRFREIINSGV